MTTLYRGLLQDAARFFDPVCRVYFKRYIKQRFKLARKFEPSSERAMRAFELGRRHRNLFARAYVKGDIDAIDRLLNIGYGRVGRRKHELLKPLKSFPMIQQPSLVGDNPRFRPLALPMPLHALFKSQRSHIKYPSDIPKADAPSWKPIGVRLQINRTYRNLSKNLRKVWSPVSVDEQSQVQQYANGHVEELVNFSKKSKHGRDIYSGLTSSRFLARRYQRLLGTLPSLTYSKINEHVSVNWKSPTKSVVASHDLPLFNGVNVNGKLNMGNP